MGNNRLFFLIAIITAAVLIFIACRAVCSGITKDFSAAMKCQEREGRITAHRETASEAYKVLDIRDFYDGICPGIKVLAEAQDGKRNVFQIVYDPVFHDSPPSDYCFFDMLTPGDRISISVDEDGGIRAMPYYG